MIKIIQAKKILTMNPRNPVATHMSMLNGRILQVGSIEKITPSEKYELDDSFKDLIIMPGLVEGHSHLFEGALWSKLYCGYFDRQKPDGSINQGIKNIDQLINNLKNEEKKISNPTSALSGWGLDPIYFSDKNLDRVVLDLSLIHI